MENIYMKSPERIHLTAADDLNSVEQSRSEELPMVVPLEIILISGLELLRESDRLRHATDGVAVSADGCGEPVRRSGRLRDSEQLAVNSGGLGDSLETDGRIEPERSSGGLGDSGEAAVSSGGFEGGCSEGRFHGASRGDGAVRRCGASDGKPPAKFQLGNFSFYTWRSSFKSGRNMKSSRC